MDPIILGIFYSIINYEIELNEGCKKLISEINGKSTTIESTICFSDLYSMLQSKFEEQKQILRDYRDYGKKPNYNVGDVVQILNNLFLKVNDLYQEFRQSQLNENRNLSDLAKSLFSLIEAKKKLVGSIKDSLILIHSSRINSLTRSQQRPTAFNPNSSREKSYTTYTKCVKCGGHGRLLCSKCRGQGVIIVDTPNFGLQPKTCPICKLQGYLSCHVCKGTGYN